jgi:predicted DNA-binding protein
MAKVGRPPAGLRSGEKVKDYPQLSLRIPPDVRATLAALSKMRGQPQWRIIIDILECYLREQSDQERRSLREFMRRSRSSNDRRRGGAAE